MSTMQAWFVPVEGEPQSISVEFTDGILSAVSKRFFNGDTLDLTKVRFKGRLCHMAVDDEGHCKGLPYNKIATEAYLANCYPGTTHTIAGPAVIFGGLLP